MLFLQSIAVHHFYRDDNFISQFTMDKLVCGNEFFFCDRAYIDYLVYKYIFHSKKIWMLI